MSSEEFLGISEADLPVSSDSLPASAQESNLRPDVRVYVPSNEDWDVHIKRDSDKLYCYAKLPGQEWFHMLLQGEIYVTRDHEKYCLRCALRLGYLTQDRLFWQHRVAKKPDRAL